MAGQIRMSPETMRERANQVRTEGTNFETAINNLQNLINTLQGEWEGAASSAYASQFGDLKPSFNKMRELVDQIGTQLDQTAAATEQLDQEIASKFGV